MASSVLHVFFFFLFLSACAASPWDKFVNLTGCRPGDTHPGLPDLKKYLQHFGYLPNVNENQLTDSFDDDLLSALSTYQLNFNLDVSGVLDLPTINQLIAPRCGVPDIVNGTTSMASGGGRLHYSFFPGNPKWPPNVRQLSYAIDTISGAKIDNPAAIRTAIASAFSRWRAVTRFTFTEVSPNVRSHIRIGFYKRNHGDGYPFDGQGGVLAHAFAPTDGRFHIDGDEDWFIIRPISANSFHLESVATHEIGHLLGLGHSSVAQAIMYPSIARLTRKVNLHSDDILGIRTLYGWNSPQLQQLPMSY